MQLLLHSPSHDLPSLRYSSLPISYFYTFSPKCEGHFYLFTCLPYRSWFQNQDCGAQREEDQTPDLVSRRQDVGSCSFSMSVMVKVRLWYERQSREGSLGLLPSTSVIIVSLFAFHDLLLLVSYNNKPLKATEAPSVSFGLTSVR